ncbi:MAG: hypothetical protein IKW39_02445 [Alphaproteobacteria bacterium]|nr:hypothetical protein [Alphaproteobacteria bacterium]
MELKELMLTWKQVGSANNEELLAIVKNNHRLDDRSQIIVSQRGDDKVLDALFLQEDICPEAKFYMAKRGSANIHFKLLQEDYISNSIQTVIAKKATHENALILANKDITLCDSAQITLVERKAKHTDLMEALIQRKDLCMFTQYELAIHGSPEMISALLQNDEVADCILVQIASRNDVEIHRHMLQRKNLPETVLNYLVTHCDVSLLNIILEREDISLNNLNDVARRADTHLFEKIIHHKYRTDVTLNIIIPKCSSAQLEMISRIPKLNENNQVEIVKKIQKNKSSDKNQTNEPFVCINQCDKDVILTMFEMSNVCPAAMIEILKLNATELTDIIINDENIPAKVQIFMSEEKNDTYKEILLAQKKLSPKAQSNIAKTRNETFILYLLKRDDLAEVAMLKILKDAINRRGTIVKNNYLDILLQRKKLPPKVQERIFATRDREYIKKLLSLETLDIKVKHLIHSLSDSEYLVLLKEKHEY